MSLRSYLFSLIGGLIVLLTLAQLFLVNWIEQTLTNEVNSKAKVLSQQMIELVFDEIENNEIEKGTHKIIHSSINAQSQNIEIKVIKDKFKTSLIDPDIKAVAVYKEDGINNKVAEQIPVSKQVITSELKSLFEQQVRKISNDDLSTIVIQDPQPSGNIWFEQHSTFNNNKTKDLVSYVQLGLIICAIVALIFAYWLSIQFNKPLRTLIFGFKSLAEGNYNCNVNESGVNEIKTTIKYFNNMVQRLNKLTSAEKQHKEIAHLAELGEVSRGLAHALRNPIHTIGLSIEQLGDPELSTIQRNKLIKTVQNKISHIDKNIKALLTLTSSGITRDQNVPVLAVIQDILLEYKSCQPKPQKFVVAVDPKVTILGAESEVRSILHTLIINACEANPINGKITIELSKQQNGLIKVNVIDEGKGLDKTISPQLFQPHTSTKPEGAGMGLYIAKRIITLHYQGELTLTNKVEETQSNTGCIAQAIFKTG